jgi:endonuclease-3
MWKRLFHVPHPCRLPAEAAAVPNVLESLIGTILSQNTSARNSTAAKRSLDSTFGRNDFSRIAAAPRADVVEALKMGGLANKKAGVIQKILGDVHERHGDYSLQHLSGLGDEAVMNGPDVSCPCFDCRR